MGAFTERCLRKSLPNKKYFLKYNCYNSYNDYNHYMNYVLPDLRKAPVAGKKVFLRADLDVPLAADGTIEDYTRVEASRETIAYLLDKGASVIIGSKLGRPEGKVVPSLSLAPVAQWLAKEFGGSVEKATRGEFEGWTITPNCFLLENLRFFKEEQENDSTFAKKLASLAEIYVNDAFAMAHRNDASIIGIPLLLPHYAGLHLTKEVTILENVLEHPDRPLVVVIGGKKVETKLPLVEKMHSIAEYVLVGGKIAQEKEILQMQHEKITIKKSVLLVGELNASGTDITEKTAENFLQIIAQAKTIIWNGPLGIIENSKLKIQNAKLSPEDTSKGSQKIAQGIASSNAYKVVGGGDTVEFIDRLALEKQFDFISTGGGAMLSLLSGETLPGLEALQQKND